MHPIYIAVALVIAFVLVALAAARIHVTNERRRAHYRHEAEREKERIRRIDGLQAKKQASWDRLNQARSSGPERVDNRDDGPVIGLQYPIGARDFTKGQDRPTGKVYMSSRGQDVRRPSDDAGFDTTGFAFGLATGMPISPSRGVSAEAIVGSRLHSNSSMPSNVESAPAAPASDPSPSCSVDSSSSSSSSFDSGSSSCSVDSGGGGL